MESFFHLRTSYLAQIIDNLPIGGTLKGISMGPVLNALVKLQSVETRLRAAQAKLTRCRRKVIIQENQLRTLQNTLEAKKEEIQLTKMQTDRLELDLKTKDEELARFRAALNTAKSNKEYAAILTELNTAKADSNKTEQQVLELMKIVEADEAECMQLKAQIAEQLERVNEIRRENEEQAGQFEKEIEQIKKEWEQASREVPPEPLRLFGRLTETYEGEAIAICEPSDDRNSGYTCGGCFMGLTIETANRLMSRDELIRCPNCTRILVMATLEK